MAAPAAAEAVDVMDTVAAFFSLCKQVESDTRISIKQEMVSGFLARYKGDLELLFRLLIPKQAGRLYRLQDKQLIKLLSTLLRTNEIALKNHLNNSGCIGATARHFFQPAISFSVAPAAAAAPKLPPMTLKQLDGHLQALSEVTTEVKQMELIGKFLRVASRDEVFIYFRQIKQDLRLGAGLRSLLAALHPNAYALYQQCANIADVVKKVVAGDTTAGGGGGGAAGATAAGGEGGDRVRSPSPGARRKLDASITLNMPIAPMLAAPSKRVDDVLAKCPNGAFSEVKYDGERIQIHKDGAKFQYFARSLKVMKEDKYEGLQKPLEAALAKTTNCILDGEILMVDRKTSQPLAFGSLGKHKKAMFADANTGLFIFDILFLDGKSLLSEPLDKRRQLLVDTLVVQPFRVLLSEKRTVSGTPEQRTKLLDSHFQHAIKEGLEGLVVKDIKSVYEPNARHWVKMKKDYLAGMADSADLVVLGGWYGSGNKGGLLSTFLMGCLDKSLPPNCGKRWKTVVKVGNGHDDATITLLNAKYKTAMEPCTRTNPPGWLHVNTSHVPDMVIKDPAASDVWEIIGAEFTQTKNHTAAGISFRFPRVIRIRDDKTSDTATSLQELMALQEASKAKATRTHILPGADDGADATTAAAAAAEAVDLAGDEDDNVSEQSVQGHRDDDENDEDQKQQQGWGGGETTAAVSPFAAVAASAVGKEEERQRGRVVTPVSSEPAALPPPPPARTATKAPTAATPTAATPTLQRRPTAAPAPPTTTGGSGIPVVAGDITLAARDAADAGGTKGGNHIIAHIVAAGGRWSQRGVMGALNTAFGKGVADDYNRQSRGLSLGNVVVSEGYKSPGGKIVFIASIAAQSMPRAKGEAPPTDPSAVAVGISKLASLAMRQGAHVHFAKPSVDDPAMPWGKIEDLLVKHITGVGLKATVYGRAGSTVAPSSASLHEGEGGKKVATTAAVLPSGAGDVFAAVKFWIDPSSFSKREVAAIAQKAELIGGTQAPCAAAATHLILDPVVRSNVLDAEVPDLAGVQVACTRQWIDDCFEKEKLLNQAHYSASVSTAVSHHLQQVKQHPDQPSTTAAALGEVVPSLESRPSGSDVFNLLKGCRVVIQGYVNPAHDELKSKVVMMGGVVHDKWSVGGRGVVGGPSTHMICGFWCPQAMKASDTGGAVVSRLWLDACMEKGVLQPMDKFYVTETNSGPPLEEDDEEVVVVKRRTTTPSPPPPKQQTKTVPPVVLEISDDDISAPAARASPALPPSTTMAPRQKGKTTTDRKPPVLHLDTRILNSYDGPKVFHGLSFFIEGYAPKYAAALKNRIELLGGTLASHWSSTVSYIVSDTHTTITDTIATRDRGKIISHCYITACFEKKAKLDSTPFAYDAVRKRGREDDDVTSADTDDGDVVVVKRRAVPQTVSSSSATDTDEDVDLIAAAVSSHRAPREASTSQRQQLSVCNLARHGSASANKKPSLRAGSESTLTASTVSDFNIQPTMRTPLKRGRSQQHRTGDSSTEIEDEDEDTPPPVAARGAAADRLRQQRSSESYNRQLAASLPPAIFAGHAFLLCLDDVKKKKEIQRLVLAYGGSIKRQLTKQSSDDTTAAVLHRAADGTGSNMMRTTSSEDGSKYTVIACGSTDSERYAATRAVSYLPTSSQDRTAVIVSTTWITSCVNEKKLLPPTSFLVSTFGGVSP